MKAIIRLVRAQDAGQILAIYGPIVRDTAISFETEAPTEAEMRRRLASASAWLVCEHRGELLGYAYAGKYRARAAYQWSVEVSAYVHERARRLGIGRALYTSLFSVLRVQGFINAYAGIALPNPASVGLHESLGFQVVGVYRAVGYKLGAWRDVGWWQLPLQARPSAPHPPLELKAVDASALQTALARGLPLLHI